MLLALLFEPALERALTVPDGPDLTRYFLACGGLLALVCVLAWGFKRLFARTLQARAAKRSLRVLDVLPLGGSKRLVVVRCYDRVFLIGQGEKELCKVAELDEDQLAERDAAAEEAEAPATLDVPADFERELTEAGGPAVRPAPRRPVLEGGRGILG